MKRAAATALAGCIALGLILSFGADEPDASSGNAQLEGKAVILQGKDVGILGPREGVRVATLGSHDFLVLPLSDPGTGDRDYWLPMSKVEGFEVFETMQEATESFRHTQAQLETQTDSIEQSED